MFNKRMNTYNRILYNSGKNEIELHISTQTNFKTTVLR